MSDSDSDLDLGSLPPPPPANESLESLQRKEIEALRRQVLEKSSENSILTSRMRDIDASYTKQLNEQVVSQTTTRAAQVAELEALKRELAASRKKNSFLELEVKTLETNPGGGANSARVNVDSDLVGDGFTIKKRRLEAPTAPPSSELSLLQDLASCELANGQLAMTAIGADHMAKILILKSPLEVTKYLIQTLTSESIYLLPAYLKLLSISLGHAEVDPVSASTLRDLTLKLLGGFTPFPSPDTPGDLFLDRNNCFSFTSLLYILDVLINTAPTALNLEDLQVIMKHSCPLISYRGLVLLELQPHRDKDFDVEAVLGRMQCPPSLELLFAGLEVEHNAPLDAMLITVYSDTLLHLDWKKSETVILCHHFGRKLQPIYNRQVIRAISTKPDLTPQLWFKVVLLLLESKDERLTRTCVWFLWSHMPLPNHVDSSYYANILTTCLARIASLTKDQDLSFWAQDVLRQIVSPHEDDMLRYMMEF